MQEHQRLRLQNYTLLIFSGVESCSEHICMSLSELDGIPCDFRNLSNTMGQSAAFVYEGNRVELCQSISFA